MMAVKKKRRTGGGTAAAWTCAYAAMLTVCAWFLFSGRETLTDRIELECSPLVLKAVTVINRQDRQSWYAGDMEPGEVLYEIRVEYENIADYHGELWGFPNILDTGTGRYLDPVEEGNPDLREWNQVIPAGKTGTVSQLFAAEADTEQIRLEEREEKLSGEKKTVTLALPGEAGEAVRVTAE